MAAEVTGRVRPTKPKKQARGVKRKRGDGDLNTLEKAVEELDLKSSYKSFEELPLSDETRAGLSASHFSTLTDIQAKAIPTALKGKDILGAARTGSGKTLAFVVPVLENLYRSQCIGADAGLGAMVVSPTRELAIQIFEVLRQVGRKGHLFAAGLVIGGKSLKDERDALARMNIVVCTPGRMLQHLSQTATFSVDSLQMLVLDEADRILDMGFQKDVDAIIDYLPRERQTLLFSATQTKRVADLARLSLKDPEYIAVHESAASATPKSLQQNYVTTPLSEKLDTLWSFLQSTKKAKILVFLSSGKQVRYVYETFRHMQPGIPLLHLHGRQKQTARLEVTKKFSNAKHSCLFCTDVAARGLDFPAVDWVVQVDCPEDADTYIHRVGRTARYEREGRAVLFLDPSEEEGMLERLEGKRVPIERINVRAKKQTTIKNQMQSMCFKDPQLKHLGQKAFASYTRSLHVQKDKGIFKLDQYDLEGFAASLGLPGAPRIKFLKGDAGDIKKRKNASRQAAPSESDADSDDGVGDGEQTDSNAKGKKDIIRTKYDRMFERQNQDILADHYARMIRAEDDEGDADGTGAGREGDDDDDDLFAVKRRIPAEGTFDPDSMPRASDAAEEHAAKTISIPGAKAPLVLDSKRREKLVKSKKKLLKLKDSGRKVVFDDDGNPHEIYELEDEEAFRARGEAEAQRKHFLDEEAERVKIADVADKALAKEKRREKRDRRKERERAEAAEEEGGAPALEGEEDALANFIADAGGSGTEEDEDDEPPARKKPKKEWVRNGVGVREETERGMETLDDLEAEAARLLA